MKCEGWTTKANAVEGWITNNKWQTESDRTIKNKPYTMEDESGGSTARLEPYLSKRTNALFGSTLDNATHEKTTHTALLQYLAAIGTKTN